MKEGIGAEERFVDFNIVSCVEMSKGLAGRISPVVGTMFMLAEDDPNAIIYKEPYGAVLGTAPW